jgi:hypothetical protein
MGSPYVRGARLPHVVPCNSLPQQKLPKPAQDLPQQLDIFNRVISGSQPSGGSLSPLRPPTPPGSQNVALLDDPVSAINSTLTFTGQPVCSASNMYFPISGPFVEPLSPPLLGMSSYSNLSLSQPCLTCPSSSSLPSPYFAGTLLLSVLLLKNVTLFNPLGRVFNAAWRAITDSGAIARFFAPLLPLGDPAEGIPAEAIGEVEGATLNISSETAARIADETERRQASESNQDPWDEVQTAPTSAAAPPSPTPSEWKDEEWDKLDWPVKT